jgi:hypothetical protein
MFTRLGIVYIGPIRVGERELINIIWVVWLPIHSYDAFVFFFKSRMIQPFFDSSIFVAKLHIVRSIDRVKKKEKKRVKL